MAKSYVSRAMLSQKRLLKEQVSDVVLENPNISVQKSLDFMKQLTVVAVSSVAFLRGIFPAHSFQTKRLAGHQVFVLQGSEEVAGSKILINWIKGAFVLVHSHYLRKMVFVIQRETVTLETYTFSFSYNQDAVHYDLHSEVAGKEVQLEQSQGLPEDIAKSVRQLVRSILTLTTTLHPLPNDCEISVKLLVDENTPTDKLPEYFHPFAENDVFNFPAEAETQKLGKVETKYTTFAVSSKSVMDGESYTYGEVNQEENNLSMEDVEDEVASSQIDHLRVASLSSNVSQLERNHSNDNKAPENDSNTTNLSEKLSIVSLKDKTISCICECSDLYDDTIKCVSCSTFQHKTCYKLLECHQVESHVCVKCHNPSQGRICSVPELLSGANRKESALYRQALMYCCNNSQVSCKRIMTHLRVPRRMAEKIFQQLDTDGFLQPPTNKGYVRNVELDLKENILGRYFSAPTSTDSTLMDTRNSPVKTLSEVNASLKRHLSEEKENISSPQQPKRRKLLSTASSLKKKYYV